MGVDQTARVSEAISENAARGRNNTANTRGKSKRRTGEEEGVVIGVEKIVAWFILQRLTKKRLELFPAAGV
jgi:hypothetical protein